MISQGFLQENMKKKNSLSNHKKLVFLSLIALLQQSRKIRELTKNLEMATLNLFKTYAFDTHLNFIV